MAEFLPDAKILQMLDSFESLHTKKDITGIINNLKPLGSHNHGRLFNVINALRAYFREHVDELADDDEVEEDEDEEEEEDTEEGEVEVIQGKIKWRINPS